MKNKKNIYIVARLVKERMLAMDNLFRSLGYKVEVVADNPTLINKLKSGIVIMDCPSLNCDSQGFPVTTPSYIEKHKVILAHSSKGDVNEVSAIQMGCSGVLYEHLRDDEIIKAIYTIQANEYWFSRKNIALALINLTKFSTPQKREELLPEDQAIVDSLTSRELTILGLVCKGANNNEIADSLFISLHTVKTHIYSAFRKTQCKNRVELIYWAMKNGMSMQLTA
jgi:DNA-binding NarL/FixJ family response regulator